MEPDHSVFSTDLSSAKQKDLINGGNFYFPFLTEPKKSLLSSHLLKLD